MTYINLNYSATAVNANLAKIASGFYSETKRIKNVLVQGWLCLLWGYLLSPSFFTWGMAKDQAGLAAE
jgi:hypothetical protein